MPTKVVLLTDTLRLGGAERSMTILADGLARSGKYEIVLAVLEDECVWDLHPEVQYRPLSAKRVYSTWGKFLTLESAARKLKTLTSEFGASVVLSFQYRSNYVNALGKMLGGHYHAIGSDRNYAPFRFASGLSGLINRALIRKLYPRLDEITCNARLSGQALVDQFGIPKEKIHSIPNGYDSEEIRRRAQGAIPDDIARWMAAGDTTLVTVGRLATVKGQRDLLEAVKLTRSPDRYRLVFVGDGPDRHAITNRVRELQLTDQVRLVGLVENPFPYTMRADIVVIPSHFEGYPNTMAEALILGKPVLATRFPAGSEEILRDGQAGTLVPCGDHSALAAALDQGVPNLSHHASFLTVEDLTRRYMELLDGLS